MSRSTKNDPRNEQLPDKVIEIERLHYNWPGRSGTLLDIEAFSALRGDHLFIIGPSGCGKTTLLGILAGIIPVTGSRVCVLGHRLEAMSGTLRDRFRADHLGYIFQLFNLIPYLSVLENVMLPCRFSVLRRQRAQVGGRNMHDEALRLLNQLGLDDPVLLNSDVTELSVGQQQRVAAARALIGAPELIIADEPTSSLDTEHRDTFLRLLFEECDKADATLVFVSHDKSLAGLFNRTIDLRELGNSRVNQAQGGYHA